MRRRVEGATLRRTHRREPHQRTFAERLRERKEEDERQHVTPERYNPRR